MFNLIMPWKDMSDLWIICCVLCCFSPIKCQTVSILENTTNWFTAFQTCKMQHGRLPAVNISNDQLDLKDRSVTKNISSPFWIGATYDFLDINRVQPSYGYVYPYTCCEKIWNIGGSHQVECLSCSGWNAFVCATWRHNRNCLHSLMGNIHEVNCYNTSMTTVCIFEAKYTISISKPTESMQFQTIKNGTIATSPSIHATLTNSTDMATDEERMTDKGAVIGGVVGSVVVTIVITFVIVVLVRKNRLSKDGNDQTEHHVIAHNREMSSIFNSCYGVRRNASLEKGNTETPTQTEVSIDFQSQPQKHKVKEQLSSHNGKTAENTNDRVVSALYSVVRKDLKSNNSPNSGKQIKGSEDNAEEYDKLSYCSKSNQTESSGNVYDRANFKHHDNSEYDTTYNINISIDTTYDHV